MTRDITQHKLAEDLLHAREEEYRALAEHTSDAIVRYDENGRHKYVNPSFERLTGKPAAQLIGKTARAADLGNVDVGTRSQQAIERVVREQAPVEIEVSWKDAAGNVCHFQNRFTPEFGRDGTVTSVLSVARDITTLKRTEEELRKLSRAVEQSPVSIVITDLDGKIEYVNPKLCQVTGYTQAEVLGRTPRILKSGEMSQAEYRQLWQTIKSGKEWRGEFHNRKKNGELFWELASLSPIFDGSGTITHFLAVKEDITEHKRLEHEFRQAQKMEAFGQLAGGVAHDFNNLLTVIQGNATLLETGTLSEDEQGEALRQISQASERASSLTRQLLMFSRRQAVRLESLDLNDVVLNMTKMLQRLIGEHITLVSEYAPGGAPVQADVGMMEQVLMNLAVNSRDAMPNGGRLSIQTKLLSLGEDATRTNPRARPGRFVRLSVADTGEGIAPEHLAQIFEPFFTTKDIGKGTGLGLATVFGILEQHRGWIEVESRLSEGTTFRYYLPHLDDIRERRPERRPLQGQRGGSETVLLVEDEPSLRRLARRLLERQGYRVHEAESAIAALSVWSEHRDEIALLLTDMVMPDGMSGWELSKCLQAEKPSLKVIYSSGYTDEMLGDASCLRGAFNFLEKPYKPGQILAKVRDVLDQV